MISYILAPNIPSKPYMAYLLGISFISIYYHFKRKQTINGMSLSSLVLRHSTIYIFAFSIVYFQHDIDYVIGIADPTDSWYFENIWVGNPHIIARALALSVLSLVSFLFGYTLYAPRPIKTIQKRYNYYHPKFLCFFGFGLIGLYLVQSGFGANPDEDENRGVLVLLQAVIISSLSIYCYLYKNKVGNFKSLWKQLRLPLTLCLVYLLIVVATGKRGGVIKIGFCILLVYVYMIKTKIPYFKILSYFIGSMLLMTLVGLLRHGSQLSTSEAMNLLSSYKTILPFTFELASSIQTLHVALSYYPDVYDYNMGSSFFPGFSILVPGLSRTLTFMGLDFSNSEEIITKLFFGGYIPDWGWGLGSSSVADVYISFGMIGVVFIFTIIGYFFKYLEIATFCRSSSPYIMALSLCCYSQIFPLCRGPISILFLSLSYSYVFIFISRRSH